MAWWNPLSWFRWLLGNRKADKKRVEDAAYTRAYSELLGLGKEADDLAAAAVTQAGGVASLHLGGLDTRMRAVTGRYTHLNREQKRKLSGVFRNVQAKIRDARVKINSIGRRKAKV